MAVGPNDKYKVNFAGLTTERTRSGKQSYKLDITFIKDGNYNYWAGPVIDIPAVKGMKLTGYIYVETRPSNVSVGLGHSFFVPALKVVNPGSAGRGSCGPIRTIRPDEVGKWVKMDSDLNSAGQAMSNTVLKQLTPGVLMEKWMIHIISRNAKNARLVLYIDDFSVEGEVPDQYEYFSNMELSDWAREYKAGKAISGKKLEKAMSVARKELMKVIAGIPQKSI
ncbi:MAG: hypothetical protein QGG48_11395, partial [Desulfatiglandales bacterium]|nr:hypothetical protein [Desulfatiglandales bacterium]